MSAPTAVTVLLVDDEPDVRIVARHTLQQNRGFRVIEADCGARAVELAASVHPDVVLLDVMMPEMDGPDVLRRLAAREDTASIPIIFLTAKAMPDELQRLRNLGALSIITKPFDPRRLAGQITDALSARRRADVPTAPQPADERSLPTLDVGALRKLAGLTGDSGRSLIADLTDLFATQTPITLATLRTLAASPSGGDEAERLAHSLKSSAATLGAVEISALAASIEQLVSAGRLAEIRSPVDRIEQTLTATVDLLRLESARTDSRTPPRGSDTS